MVMKKILLAAIVSLSLVSVKAQFVLDYLKSADSYFEKGDYASAAEYYEKYFDRDSSYKKREFIPYTNQNPVRKMAPAMTNQERAIYNLAESYRLLNYPAKAEPYYKEAMEMNKARFPLAQFHLGTVERALAKYPEAEQSFKAFLAEYKTDDSYAKNANRELQNLQYIQAQLKKNDLKYYTITKAPAELNSVGGNYAPVWLNNTTLLFTSTRPDDSLSKASKDKKQYRNKVYQAVYSEGIVAGINRAELPQAKGIEQGVVSITPDGNTMFLTRWSVEKKAKSSAIYKSTRTDKGWSDPVMLDASINVPGSSSQQPSVTPDGKYLLYASDRTGGQGGFDLWYAELVDGNPGQSSNLGTNINTTYNEQAPFYHAPSGSLIFSTDGRVGMGGYDFFQSKGIVGNLQTPENLGYPTNSVKDDIYFTSRSTAKNILDDVLLSSDRDAACCLELFYLKKMRPDRQISGQVASCDPTKPFKGGTVTIVDTVTNTVVHTEKIGSDGKYSFTLKDYQPLTVKATAEGFFNNSMRFGAPNDPEADSLTNSVLCLTPVPEVNETFVVENVYYDFDKADLKTESYPALDEIIRMLEANPSMTIEIGAHTDSKGSDKYNQRLSDARAKSVVDYLVSKGVDSARLTSKGYGEAMPIAPNTNEGGGDNPEGREKNRRTEFKVLKKD
jgi:outer membrane protein OmpA-like peptidoglycan-associated protein/tetratricopeptide (TPR) repeat protein